MKLIKHLTICAAVICAATLITGCACCGKCKEKKVASCGMKCCEDGKATCATCPVCSAKK